jgi:hypothetical protein
MLKILLNVLLLLVLLCAGALLPAVRSKWTRQKKAQDRIVSWVCSQDSGRTGAWHRIKFSRPAHYTRLFKLTGCEGRGILIDEPHHVRVVGELDSGERLDIRYAKNALALQWIGSSGIRSSNMYWFALGLGGQQLMVTADTGFIVLQSREATADLCRVIAPNFDLPTLACSEFALEKNPATRTAIIVLFGLLAFACFDGIVFNKYELLNGGRVLWALPLCIAVQPLLYWMLSRRGVPWRESFVVAGLICIAFAAAYIPTLKRIDQFLAADGPRPYAYRLNADALFTPLSEGGPPQFRGRKRDWSAFKEGTIHEVSLVHGPLGLWQLDSASLDEKLRAAKGNDVTNP